MQRQKSEVPAASLSRLASLLAQIKSGRRLRLSLRHLSSDEVDRALRATGRSRAELFTAFKGNPRHRRRLAFMLHHFGVDPDFATHSCWEAVRQADHTCMRCRNVGRCRSWMSWGARNDAPRIFCPNAKLLDEIAAQAPDRRAA